MDNYNNKNFIKNVMENNIIADNKSICKNCGKEIEEGKEFFGTCENCYKQIEKNSEITEGKMPSKSIKIISVIVIIIVLLIIAICIIYNNNLKNNYLNEFNKVISQYQLENIKHIKISKAKRNYIDGYLIEVNIEGFDQLEYKMQKDIFIQLKNLKYNNYYVVEVDINSQNNKYKSVIYSSMYKNNNEYTENEYLKTTILEKINNLTLDNKDYIINIINSSDDREFFITINTCLNNNDEKKIIYEYAMLCHNQKKYDESIKNFNLIKEYDNSNEMILICEKIKKIQGRWKEGITTTYFFSGEILRNKFSDSTLIIDGYNLYSAYIGKYETKINYMYIKILDNKIMVYNKNDNECFELKLDDNSNLIKYNKGYYDKINYTTTDYTYINNDTTIPQEIELKEPKIGMTKTEAENSTWGKPNDINKTTTAYGTSEQWVYYGYKYLYFDDGILTSIQE